MGYIRPAWSHRLAIALAVLAISGCSGPDLDKTAKDLSAAEIRPRLVLHQDRVRALTEAELDLLAAFLERSAGAGRSSIADDDAGRMLWIQIDCGSCHALEAGLP